MFLFPFHFLSAERQEKLINKILKVGPIFQLVCAVCGGLEPNSNIYPEPGSHF